MSRCAGERSLRAAIASTLFGLAADALLSSQKPERRTAPPLDPVTQGQAFLDGGDLTRAAASLEAAIKRNPASADAHYVLGLVRERQRDQAAAAHGPGRHSLRANMAEAHDRLGFVLGEQGGRRSDRAIRTGGPVAPDCRRAISSGCDTLVYAGVRPGAAGLQAGGQAAPGSCRSPAHVRPHAPVTIDNSRRPSISCARPLA